MIYEFIFGFSTFVLYYALAALVILMVRPLFKRQMEIFRKLLHIACTMSVLILQYAMETWYISVAVVLAFALFVYPVIAIVERYPKVISAFHQRKRGEIRSSLVLVFVMMALLTTVFWGLLGESWKFITVIAVMAWGFGDAAAAIIGKNLGRNKINHRLVEKTKTREGTIAMSVVAFVAIFLSLIMYSQLSWYVSLLTAALIAPISAVVEMFSHNGMDTITVPLATAVPTYGVIQLLSVVGL
ncbi:MAG: phosphatidate cytidylyltransferase [Thermotogota bacterium]|nr:phosphatidate cytidylyltransferase [Thermotogota bacterium]